MEIVATYMPGAGPDRAAALGVPPAGATAIELRADLLPDGTDLAGLVAASPLPVVITLRSSAEGGRGPDEPGTRRRFFERSAALPAAFFDLEAARDSELLGDAIPRERVILSSHFPDVPADLEARAKACLAHGTRFVKIVPSARSLADVLAVVRLAQAFERGKPAERRAIVFATGESAVATRLLGPLFAAPLAYAAWSRDAKAAPGQLVPEEWLALAGHLGGRPKRTFAVVGKPVVASRSPHMHNAAYRALGLPNLFVPLEVGEPEELDRLFRPSGETCLDEIGLAAGGYAVTMPWKAEAATRCDLLAPRAERARAANTVLPRHGKVLGDCTDIDGITAVLRDAGAEIGDARALVLGTGGAARAAVVALELGGAHVAIAGRDAEEAGALARAMKISAVKVGDANRVSIVVNATPAGADGAATPLLDDLAAPRGAVVIDMAYADAPTYLEQLSSRRGWHSISGREVLLFQGIAQFAAMNGVAPPVRAMAAALGLEDVQ